MQPMISTYGGPVMMDVRFRRERLGETTVLASQHIPRWLEAGIRAVVLPVDDLDEMRTFLDEAAELGPRIRVALEPDDLDPSKLESTPDSITVVLCANYESVGSQVNSVRLLHRLGVRVFSLTLNRRNLLADGCSERTQSGLSYLGVSAVKALAEHGIAIDVSHASEAAFWDVLDNVDVPIIATHSDANELARNNRNLTDEQIKAIAKRGGLIGLSMHPTLVARESPTAEHVVDHIDHMNKLVGIDHIALGTDYIDFVAEFFKHKLKVGDPSGTLYGKGEHTYPTGIETVSKLGALTSIMEKRGYSKEQISRIRLGNFIAFWRRLSSVARDVVSTHV